MFVFRHLSYYYFSEVVQPIDKMPQICNTAIAMETSEFRDLCVVGFALLEIPLRVFPLSLGLSFSG